MTSTLANVADNERAYKTMNEKVTPRVFDPNCWTKGETRERQDIAEWDDTVNCKLAADSSWRRFR